eukprot:9155501-Prorocentrum_lima.AAC.1
MTSSLVGSEMCIRDRVYWSSGSPVAAPRVVCRTPCCSPHFKKAHLDAVSYTHLTLPTICSV